MRSLSIQNVAFLGSGEFSPLNLTNLYGWWDFSDLATITKDGVNRVSQVNDKSGNSRHLTQITGGDQPLWVDNDQNGLDVIDFAGSRFLETATWVALSQPITYFIALLMPVNGGVDKAIVDSISNTSLVYKQTTDNRFLEFAGDNMGFTEAGIQGTNKYLTCIFDGTSSKYRVNGVHKNTEGTTVGTGTNNGLLVGARDGIMYSNTKIFEVIFINGSPSAVEITKTETYLANKWGL